LTGTTAGLWASLNHILPKNRGGYTVQEKYRGAEQSKTEVARHAWQGREKTLGTKIKTNYINYIRKSSKHPDRA